MTTVPVSVSNRWRSLDETPSTARSTVTTLRSRCPPPLPHPCWQAAGVACGSVVSVAEGTAGQLLTLTLACRVLIARASTQLLPRSQWQVPGSSTALLHDVADRESDRRGKAQADTANAVPCGTIQACT